MTKNSTLGNTAPKKRKANNDKGYATYLHKVLKKATSGSGNITISSKAMEVVNAILEDLENRVANKAFELAAWQKKSTLAAPHVQVASKMVFPSDMGGSAIAEGTKALTRYTA